MSFSEIMDMYTEPLIRIAYYYTKNLQTAEDIVQEVFIKFHQTSHRYHEQGEMSAYLSRCTINRSKDYLKSWHARKLHFQQRWLQPTKENLLQDLVKADEQSLVATAIMQLPIKYREVLVYYYFEEMSITQIAILLQLPDSTVKTRMRRAKELMKQKLDTIEWEVLLHE